MLHAAMALAEGPFVLFLALLTLAMILVIILHDRGDR